MPLIKRQIVKMNVTLTEALAGIIEIFVLGTFIGICIGGFITFYSEEDDRKNNILVNS
jgi:hypothetical protein